MLTIPLISVNTETMDYIYSFIYFSDGRN